MTLTDLWPAICKELPAVFVVWASDRRGLFVPLLWAAGRWFRAAHPIREARLPPPYRKAAGNSSRNCPLPFCLRLGWERAAVTANAMPLRETGEENAPPAAPFGRGMPAPPDAGRRPSRGRERPRRK